MYVKPDPSLSIYQNLLLQRIADVQEGLPQLTPGGYEALTTAETDKLNKAHKLIRFAEEDAYNDFERDIPDIPCGVRHLVEAISILSYFR
jgi:hypothetical protein